MVRKIARYVEVPHHIIEEQSSARLWKGQTAEDKIGLSYETNDKIFPEINFDKTLKNSSFPEITGVNQKDVKIVLEWIKNNRHKHELPIPRCKFKLQ